MARFPAGDVHKQDWSDRAYRICHRHPTQLRPATFTIHARETRQPRSPKVSPEGKRNRMKPNTTLEQTVLQPDRYVLHLQEIDKT